MHQFKCCIESHSHYLADSQIMSSKILNLEDRPGLVTATLNIELTEARLERRTQTRLLFRVGEFDVGGRRDLADVVAEFLIMLALGAKVLVVVLPQQREVVVEIQGKLLEGADEHRIGTLGVAKVMKDKEKTILIFNKKLWHT